MKSTRGLGNVYQPTFRDRNGKLKHTSTWWIVYHVNGRRIAENAHSTNRTDAVRLLKRKISDAALEQSDRSGAISRMGVLRDPASVVVIHDPPGRRVF